MKYGVIVYKQTANIGDDIQSYAAACLLPRVDYYIERERLDIFRPREDEPVNVIMNGWYLYNKLGWPVSACINPLYISMHFFVDDPALVGDDFLKGLGAEDLRAHGPVGARDRETQRILDKNGIPNYFSGCLTLTLLPQRCERPEKPYVCLTDVPEEVADFVQRRYPDMDIRIIEHAPVKAPALVNPEADWPERFRTVEQLLSVYQNAAAVITTRLHCALPCLALETPVLLLDNGNFWDPSRMDGLSSLVRRATTEAFLSGNAGFDLSNPPENPTDYLPIRQALLDRVQNFLAENTRITPQLRERFAAYDSQWERRVLWKYQLFRSAADKISRQWQQMHTACEDLEKGRRWLEGQRQNLEQENQELRGWSDAQEEAKQWLEAENQKLARENQELRGWSDAQEEAKQWLEEQRQKLTQQNQELRSWSAAQEEAKQWLEGQRQKLTQENSALQAQCASLDAAVRDLNKQLEQKELELQSLSSQLRAIPEFIRKLYKPKSTS